jgi:uncharacterized protein (UPF0210 family)
MEEVVDLKDLFNIRTVTCFLNVQACDLDGDDTDTASSGLARKVAEAAKLLRRVEEALVQQGYTVQTVRIATNPFGEWQWLPMDDLEVQLARLDSLLASHGIEFCSLGPARTLQELEHYCCRIVKSSPRFSCSVNLTSADVVMAKAASRCILKIAHLGSECDAGPHVQDGLGNFRFCVASSCKDYIPFFPVAKCASSTSSAADTEAPGLKFAVGLENGSLARHLLSKCQSIANVRTTFRSGMAQAIEPVQTLCQSLAVTTQSEYLGVDTSLNPSLDEAGSIARAMEALDEVAVFGGHGTIAAAAVITECLQNLPGIQRTGYCGLMLPLCEDQRLAELASDGSLRISDLLSVSNVCGVGVDTVPLPGDCTETQLTALLLDVAGIADRWNKSLSCRVFPVPGKKAGDSTNFDSPHMINARILSLA